MLCRKQNEITIRDFLSVTIMLHFVGSLGISQRFYLNFHIKLLIIESIYYAIFEKIINLVLKKIPRSFDQARLKCCVTMYDRQLHVFNMVAEVWEICKPNHTYNMKYAVSKAFLISHRIIYPLAS